MTRAIILAAGFSSRISFLTGGKPKCLLDLNGKSLLIRQLGLLADCGISDIWIITGHGASALIAAAGAGPKFRHYPNYARTNNLCTLASSADLLTGDTLVAFSDVLIARETLQRCIASSDDVTLVIDRTVVRSGTMRVKVVGNTVRDIGAHIKTEDGDGNFTGIAKISSSSIAKFREVLARHALDPGFTGAYYTEVFRSMAAVGYPIGFVDTICGDWFEIDDQDDYREAQALDFYLRSLAYL